MMWESSSMDNRYRSHSTQISQARMDSTRWRSSNRVEHYQLPLYSTPIPQTRMDSTRWRSSNRVEHYQLPLHSTPIPQTYAAEQEIDFELKLAILSRNTKTVVDMIRSGANTSIQVNGRPILHFLAMKQQVDMMCCCIEHGADPNAVDHDDKPLLHFAVELSSINAIERLLQYVDINRPDKVGCTPLFYALINPKPMVFDLLIQKGADVNVKNCKGETPLHTAAYNPQCHWLVEELLKHGADVHMRNKAGDTALNIAMYEAKGDLKSPRASVIRKLLTWGSAVDKKCAMAVHYLVSGQNCQLETLMRVILESNSVNFRDLHGRTPLHHVVRKNRIDLAEFLLENGAKVDATDCHGQTPLHLVDNNCSPQMVMLLITKGANIRGIPPIVRPVIARLVRAYFFDDKNDISPFVRAFSSRFNCFANYYCFVDIFKYLPAIECLYFFLEFY